MTETTEKVTIQGITFSLAAEYVSEGVGANISQENIRKIADAYIDFVDNAVIKTLADKDADCAFDQLKALKEFLESKAFTDLNITLKTAGDYIMIGRISEKVNAALENKMKKAAKLFALGKVLGID